MADIVRETQRLATTPGGISSSAAGGYDFTQAGLALSAAEKANAQINLGPFATSIVNSNTSKQRIGADYTNASLSANWVDIDSSAWLDVAIPAQVGDEVEACLIGRLSTGASQVFFDWFVVSGSSGRSWSNGAALNNANYSPFAYWATSSHHAVRAQCAQRVQAADLSGGMLVLRPKWRGVSGGSSVTFYATNNGGTNQVSIRNYGSDRSVALAPSLPFHKVGSVPGVVQEPSVWKGADGTWNMFYSGGWTTTYMGWATASAARGPWTDRGQVLGGGLGGEAGQAVRNNVYYDPTLPSGQQLTVFYASGGALKVAQGSSPTTLAVVGTAMNSPSGTSGMANSSVVKDGSTYRMMFEALETSSGLWKTGYATASALTGPYTQNTYPLPTLQVGGGMFGGPNLFKRGATWVLWYQCGYQTGMLPTEIFRATSTDLINWTPSPVPIIKRSHPAEFDQTADPFLVVDTDGLVHMWWSAADNVTPACSIMYADPTKWRLTDV